MTKTEALRLLKEYRNKLRDTKYSTGKVAEWAKRSVELAEALSMAITALRDLPDYKRLGKKGARTTIQKYGRSQLTEWGKMGGRPRKKPAVLKKTIREVMTPVN